MKKPNSTKTLFLVELVMPRDTTETMMNHFIDEAIRSNVGHYHPEDPFYSLDRDTISVKSQGRVLRGVTNAMKDLREAQALAKPLRKIQQG